MRAKLWQVLAAGAAMGCAAPLTAQDVKSGIEAWQARDYARAVEIWRPLAQAGDADAAFNLGQAYRLGRGVAIDLASAQSWLEQAARAGHMDAQTTLGLLLFGSGNHTGGLRWLRQAADKGEPRAMLIYGTALFNGDGTPPDQVKAYAYVSRAAAQGFEPAKRTLEQMNDVLPLEARKKGLALAMEKAKAAEPKPATKEPSPKAPAQAAATAPPAKTPAKPAAARPASPAPVSSGKWRIQLGAFSSRASAEALFRRLSSSAPVAGRQLHLVPAGAVTRLQVGPFESRAAAATACRAMSAKGQACFVVSAK